MGMTVNELKVLMEYLIKLSNFGHGWSNEIKLLMGEITLRISQMENEK